MSNELLSDRTYVMDRGNAKFELFNKIVAADSSYLYRIRDNSVLLSPNPERSPLLAEMLVY